MSMGINIRRNNNTLDYAGAYPKPNGTEQIKTPYALGYKSKSGTLYVPLILAGTAVTEGSIIKTSGTYYRCISNTVRKGFLRVQVNGELYHAVNMSAFTNSSYAIPAGTYTPQVFKYMILSFIARGSGTTRAVDRATSVTVNNQTVSLAKGALIRYQYQGTSPFHLDFVTFGRNLANNEYWFPFVSGSGFTNYKAYCVDRGPEGAPGQIYATYYDYSIKVNTSFNFS